MTIKRISNRFLINEDGKERYEENLDETFENLKKKLKNRFSNDRQSYEFTYEIKEVKSGN